MIVRQIWIECDRCRTKAFPATADRPAATVKTAREWASKLGFRHVATVLGWSGDVCAPCAKTIGLKR